MTSKLLTAACVLAALSVGGLAMNKSLSKRSAKDCCSACTACAAGCTAGCCAESGDCCFPGSPCCEPGGACCAK